MTYEVNKQEPIGYRGPSFQPLSDKPGNSGRQLGMKRLSRVT